MGKFRRFLKRLVKPAAFAAVAAGVALSLVVTTPSNAQAFVGPVIPPPVIAGAAEMVLPEVMATSAVLGPVGWGIAGVTAIGVGLYVTKDYWLPYVTGTFGQPTPGAAQGPADPGGSIVQSFDFIAPPGATAIQQTLNGIQMTLRYSGSAYQNGFNYGITATLQCKVGAGNTADGVSGTIYTTRWGMGSNSGNTGGPYGGDDTWKTYCHRSEDSLVGAVAGAYGADPDLWKKTDTASGMYGKDFPGPMSVGRLGTEIKGDAGFDPKGANVTYKTTVECIRPDGSKFNVETSSVGTDGAIKFAACGAVEPGAHGTGKASVDALVPNRTTTRVWDVKAPTASPDYPLCDPSRPGQGCKLQVLHNQQPCTMGTFACENWDELSKDPNHAPEYGCEYGPYAVDMSICNPLERAYEPEGTTATEKNTDGEPGTQDSTDPNGNPRPSGDAPPVTGIDVIGGGGTVTGSAPPEAQQCWPSGWGMFNPVEWVYDPMVCAAKALFEPKTDVQTRVETMKGQFSNKVPVSWFMVQGSQVGNGGCPTDWAIDYRGQHYSLICGTPADGILRSFRPVLGGMLTVAMLWPFLRSLFYSAIPIFKVTPS